MSICGRQFKCFDKYSNRLLSIPKNQSALDSNISENPFSPIVPFTSEVFNLFIERIHSGDDLSVSELSMDSNVDNSNLSDAASTCSNSSFPSYPVGSYVMASWKNNYEYLAEVLGHRKRQGERIDYKLKYVWDRVTEWSSSNKVREATQYEIDYVLRLCKQHNMDVEETIERPMKKQCVKNSSKSTTCSTTVLNTSVDASQKDDDLSSSSSSVKSTSKKIRTNAADDYLCGQDDMVYDKSVAQFHKACKRRRQLKSNFDKNLPTSPLANEKSHPPASESSLSISSYDTIKSNDCKPTKEKDKVVEYPCPHCPRKLRREKLLKAHIANYHVAKSIADDNSSTKSCESNPVNKNNISVMQMKNRLDGSSESPCQQSVVTKNIDCATHIQCEICLTWSHRFCVFMTNVTCTKWQCVHCAEAYKIKKQRNLLHLWNSDWMTGSKELAMILPSNNSGGNSKYAMPTPPNTPPVHQERSFTHNTQSLKKKALSESAAVMNCGIELKPLFAAAAHYLKLVNHSLSNENKVAKTFKVEPTIQPSLDENDANQNSQSLNQFDENINELLMAFKVFDNIEADNIMDVLPSVPSNPLPNVSIPTNNLTSSSLDVIGNSNTCPSTNNTDGSGILQEIGPDILRDLMNTDNMVDDIQEFLGAAVPETLPTDDNLDSVNSTPNKQFAAFMKQILKSDEEVPKVANNNPSDFDNIRRDLVSQIPNITNSAVKENDAQIKYEPAVQNQDPITQLNSNPANFNPTDVQLSDEDAVLASSSLGLSPVSQPSSNKQVSVNTLPVVSCSSVTSKVAESIPATFTRDIFSDTEPKICNSNSIKTDLLDVDDTRVPMNSVTKARIYNQEYLEQQLMNPMDKLLTAWGDRLKELSLTVDNLESLYRKKSDCNLNFTFNDDRGSSSFQPDLSFNSASSSNTGYSSDESSNTEDSNDSFNGSKIKPPGQPTPFYYGSNTNTKIKKRSKLAKALRKLHHYQLSSRDFVSMMSSNYPLLTNEPQILNRANRSPRCKDSYCHRKNQSGLDRSFNVHQQSSSPYSSMKRHMSYSQSKSLSSKESTLQSEHKTDNVSSPSNESLKKNNRTNHNIQRRV